MTCSKKLTSKEVKLRKSSRTVGSVGFQPIPSWRSTAPSGLLCTWLHDVSKTNTTQHATRCGNDVMSSSSTQHQKFVHTEPVFKNLYSTEYALLWFLTHAHISHLAHLLQRFKTFTCRVKLPQMDLVKLTLHAVNDLYNETWTTCTTTAEQAFLFCTDRFTKFQPIHTDIYILSFWTLYNQFYQQKKSPYKCS